MLNGKSVYRIATLGLFIEEEYLKVYIENKKR
jgi:hypothetical protein